MVPSACDNVMFAFVPGEMSLNSCLKWLSRKEPTTTPANDPSACDIRRLTPMNWNPLFRAVCGWLI